MTPTLFDESRMSRRSDPATSKAAAGKVVKSGKAMSQATFILGFLKIAAYPLTSGELSRLADIDRSTVSKRTVDLERAGLVVRGPARRCTARGSLMTVWRAV